MAAAKLLLAILVGIVCLRAQLVTGRQTGDISLSSRNVDIGSSGFGRHAVPQGRNYRFDSDTWLHSPRTADPIRNRELEPVTALAAALARGRTRRQSGDRRLQRAPATSSPLPGLSLLDLPVFSRGDRPSSMSMDKTLGAIFSKVAFAAAANTTGTKNEVFDNSSNANASVKSADSPPSTSTSTTTEATVTVLSASSTPSAATTTTTGRPKPVFELDTRVFDFIPYERTAPPPNSNQRQYNPNVPGLRGPSRINTARNPSDPVPNQPFNLRPTLPPLLIDLTSTVSRTTTTSATTASSTTTTTTTTTVATPAAPSSGRDQEDSDDVQEETWAPPTTTAATIIKSAPTTSTTTTTTTTTATPTAADSAGSEPAEDNVSVVEGGGDLKRPASDKNRETAWSFQVYGTSFLFVLLGIFALSNLLRLRTSTRRLLSTSHCLSIQLLVLFLAITRSIHLLYDAYNHKRLLPAALAFSIFNVAFPCLSSALAVLLLAMFKATKLQILPGVIVKPALWAALVAFHFALSLSIDIVVGSVGGLFSLHLASQAYFVLWSLALSLGYFAAFAPAVRAAQNLQAETMRATLTALHIHGASLPRRLPRPTLMRAVRVTLAAAVLALLVAAFQLYGMFGVYGLPWRQQQPSNQGLASANSAASAPVVLTPEFLARYQGMQRDRNLNVDALRQVLGLANSNEPRAHDHKRDPWPVAPENFWPWWTYQLIARVLEFIMAALIAYVGSQPLRHNEVLTEKNMENASKKGSLWLFTAGKTLKSGSMETLSTLCCQTNKGARARDMGGAAMGGAMTSDLSPVKSMASDEMNYAGPNTRNYCYSNPTQVSMTQMDRPSMPLPRDHHHVQSNAHAGTLPAFPIVYGSKRSQRRCASTLSHNQISSVLVNDNGFIRFREGAERQEQTYEDVDRTRSPIDNHNQSQHIYQELGHKPQSLTYYSTSTSSMTSSSANTHKCSGTATTPSTCTYEHLCRRGLAGYYEPQRYEMQLPNAQLLSLLAKESCHAFQPNNIYGSQRSQPQPPSCQHCHCKETSSCLKSPNYESYGPKPEAQTPATPMHPASMQPSEVHQGGSCSLMESYVHMLLTAQANRKLGADADVDLGSSEAELQLAMAQLRCQHPHSGNCGLQPEQDVDRFDDDDAAAMMALQPRRDNDNDIYLSQCASTCSSESAANSFDMRLYPHLTPQHQLQHLLQHHHHHHQQPVSHLPVRGVVPIASVPKGDDLPTSESKTPAHYCNQPTYIDQQPLTLSAVSQSPVPLFALPIPDQCSPDSAIVADISDVLDIQGHDKAAANAAIPSLASPLTSIFRLSSFSFRRAQTSTDDPVSTDLHTPPDRTTLHGKLFNRFRSNTSNSGNTSFCAPLHAATPLQMYGYSPLVGFDESARSPAVATSCSQKNSSVPSLKGFEAAPSVCHSVHLPSSPSLVTQTSTASAEEQCQNRQGHPQYWVSADVLDPTFKQHRTPGAAITCSSTHRLVASSAIQTIGSALELFDSSSNKSGSREKNYLEALDEKSESSPSITPTSSSSSALMPSASGEVLIASQFNPCQQKDFQQFGLFPINQEAESAL